MNTSNRYSKIIILIYTVITGSLIFSGCKLPALPSMNNKISLPERYDQQADTSSIQSISRQSFYQSEVLNDLIDTVLTRNFDLRIALQRIEYARASVGQTRGALFPQVTASVVPGLRRFGLYTMDGAGNIVTEIEKGRLVPVNLPDFYGGVQASWEADVWGKLKNKKKAAIARVLATEEGRKLIQTSLVAETASAYYELMAADQELQVIDQTIHLQEQAIEAVRVQKQAAVVNRLAVQQFEADLLALQSMRSAVKHRIRIYETEINTLAGRTTGLIRRDTGFFTRQTLPVVKAGLPSALLQNRPDIRQAEQELFAAEADIRSARAAFLPSINLNAGIGLQAYRPGLFFMFPESIAFSLAGSLAGPIVNKTAIKAEYSRANALQQEALLQYEKAAKRGFLEVSLGLTTIQNLQEVYDYKFREREILSESIQVSSELFRTGRASYLEVLLARQNALRSNIELINTRKQQFLTAITVYRALGGG